jgi:adenosine deaminase
VREGRAAALRLPKVELHTHVEATPRPSTLKELAGEHGLQLPPRLDPDSDVPLEFDSLLEFLHTLREINPLFGSPEVYGRLYYEHLEDQAADNVVYCETRFSPVRPVLDRGMDVGGLIAAMGAAGRRAQADFGIDSGLILSLSRTRDPGDSRNLTAEILRVMDGNLAGFDIADDESAGPATDFMEVFEMAAAAGLPATVHAGETMGPESIWAALKLPGIRRIGHGLTAHQDQELVAKLASDRVHLELCPISNMKTNQIESLADHPLPGYRTAGISLSVNTDDPIAFGNDISTEYAVLESVFHLTADQIRAVTLDAIDAAFASEDVKDRAKRRVLADGNG